MTQTDANTDAGVSREQLKSKPVQEWTDTEQELAKQMSHTLAASLYNTRRLERYGSKSQSWDNILEQALDRLEQMDEVFTDAPGVFLVNATGETVPLLLEDGTGDRQVLEEVLGEHGLTLEESA